MTVSLIAALSRNRVIGIENRLPWRIPEDLKRFRRLTVGHPIIMGRKTFESIGRPLSDRENLVISRNPSYAPASVRVFASLEAAFGFCGSEAKEVFVIGGAEVYRQALPRADRLYLTEIHRDIEGDAFFPSFEGLGFLEISREDHHGPLDFSFTLYERAGRRE